MKGLCWLLLLCLLVPGSAFAAEWVSVGNGGEPVTVRVLESSSYRTVLEYEIGGFERQPVEIDGASYFAVTLPGEPITLEKGLPEVPHVCRSIIIPDNARMDVRLLESTQQEIASTPIIPSKGNLLRTVDPAGVPYVFGEFYGTDGWYPTEVVTHRDPYILRDHRGMVVVVSPFQYNPETRTLLVSTHLVVEVVAVGPGSRNTLDRVGAPSMATREFDQLYGDHFLNYRFGKYTAVGEQGEMLIVAYDDFHNVVEPLVEWKNEMGMRTRMFDMSGIGTEAIDIKDFIRAYRDTVPNLVYVLLVGDGAEVPPMHAGGDASDPRFSLLDGDDYYPEILVGRFSAQSVSQAETQVQRTIDYEKYPQAGESWYHKGIGIGSAEGPGDDGEMDWEHIDNIRTDLLGFTYTDVDQIYDPGATSSQVTNALNNGRSIINYCGHGSLSSWGTTGFSTYRVSQLANVDKLPFIFDVACVNGNFENYTCFAEAWLRATQSGNATGAIGIYASSINQSWDPPMAAQDEMNDLLVQDAKRTFGGLCYNGSCLMMDEYGYAGADMFKTWHVFGDPSLRVRTDTPATLSVAHAGTMSSSDMTYEVTVSGVEGALCGLAYQGEFIGSGVTDGSGVATILIQAALPDDKDLNLTVTAFNCMPVFEMVHVQGGPAPDIRVDLEGLTLVLEPDQTFTKTLEIANDGEPGSMLNYQISIGGGATWVEAQPDNGSVPAGESVVVDLLFDSTGLSEGPYLADVIVANNARGDVVVPVDLTVQTLTDVVGRGGPPERVALLGNYPNPFNPTTTVSFALPEPARAKVAIYSVTGEHVRTVVDQDYGTGIHRVAWNGRNANGESVSAGVYLCRFEAGDKVFVKKMVMAK